jgi:hypothetical protein
LTHLQSLFLYLEEQLTGDPLDAVCEKYKHPLSSVLQAELREASPAIQKEKLLPTMREVLLQQLCTPQQDAANSLVGFVGFAFGFMNVEEAHTHSHLPSSLQLSHAYHTFIFLKKNML